VSDDGAALLAGGRFHEAIAFHAQLLRGDPQSIAARLGLARAWVGAGDAPTATAWLSDALRLAGPSREVVQLLADVLLLQRLHAQALPHYQQLVTTLAAPTAANLLHAGFCQEQVGAVEAAADLYRRSIAADGQVFESHVDLAGVLWRLEDFEGALAHARQAVALAPRNAYAQRILGTALLNLNRLDEAQQHLQDALQLQPGMPQALLDLAFVRLLQGRLAEGWPLYAQRWRDGRLQRPEFWRAECEWPGPAVPLAGKTIAVVGEQGWGDVLQALRYLPQLQALGARVCCVLPAALVPLVEASFPGVECLGPGRDLEVQLHVAAMELPGCFATTLQTIPAQVPYLRPPEAARARWRELLAPWPEQARIGLAWSGSQAQINNRNRAQPLSLLLSLAQLPGVQCFSLQKGDAGPWSDVAADPGRLVDLTAAWQDFGDSAAMIEQLDLVITVDTAVAHLAGALGKPVWILLPPNPDWRWLLEREDSPWYPTARLFRRAIGEDRRHQLARVEAALREWLAAR
jgi:tetratricopeptide (TPR) repeat protein